MPTYLTLLNFTQDGTATITDLPEQLQEVKGLKESLGGEPKGFYLTFGRYDMVAISEMPDDITTAQVQLQSAMNGTVETETLRAFDEAEIQEILDGIPA